MSSIVRSGPGRRPYTAWLLAAVLTFLSSGRGSLPEASETAGGSSFFMAVSDAVTPPLLRGVALNPDDPFVFSILLDPGDERDGFVRSEFEPDKLVRYFLSALTVPGRDFWVNLSPYEPDRIAPASLIPTEMGEDLLDEDRLLKQLTASLTRPDTSVGMRFWETVYRRLDERLGTADVPVNVFNKVWIVPAEAKVYTDGRRAFVGSARLKVLTQADYLAAGSNAQCAPATVSQEADDISLEVMREVVLPVIEREINQGARFARLRQIYHSMILAAWFKRTVMAGGLPRQGGLFQRYIGSSKLAGIDNAAAGHETRTYRSYLDAFRRGSYDYSAKEYDIVSRRLQRRRYFSGGFSAAGSDAVEAIWSREDVSAQRLDEIIAEATGDSGLVYEVSCSAVTGEDGSAAMRQVLSRRAIKRVTSGKWTQRWVLAASAQRTVSRVVIDGETAVVKRYHLPQFVSAPGEMLDQILLEDTIENEERVNRVFSQMRKDGLYVPRGLITGLRSRKGFFVFPFFDGVTLEQEANVLREEADGEKRRQRYLMIARQMAASLSVIAGKGFAHRDPSLENFLINSEGEVVLIDLGLAGRIGDVEDRLAGLATAYASPQQSMGEPPAFTDDVFGCAVALAWLWAGGFRPDDPVHKTVTDAGVNGEDLRPLIEPLLRDCPLKDVIVRALDPDPAGRYPDIDVMAVAIRGAGDVLSDRVGSALSANPTGGVDLRADATEVVEVSGGAVARLQGIEFTVSPAGKF